MAPLPKRKLSRARQGKRRAAFKLKMATLSKCPSCGELKRPHIVCKACGQYNKEEIIIKKPKAKKSEDQS